MSCRATAIQISKVICSDLWKPEITSHQIDSRTEPCDHLRLQRTYLNMNKQYTMTANSMLYRENLKTLPLWSRTGEDVHWVLKRKS